MIYNNLQNRGHFNQYTDKKTNRYIFAIKFQNLNDIHGVNVVAFIRACVVFDSCSFCKICSRLKLNQKNSSNKSEFVIILRLFQFSKQLICEIKQLFGNIPFFILISLQID